MEELREHALKDNYPTDFTYAICESETSDWRYAQSAKGTWIIELELDESNLEQGTESIPGLSLAGYSEGVTIAILLNGDSEPLDGFGDFSIDKSLYRSANVAREWHFFEQGADTFREARNLVSFRVTETAQWRGIMWDSIILEYAE